MNASGLQLIRLADDRIVVKRGVNELLLSGAGVAPLVECVVELLDGGVSREEVLGSFPAPMRPAVDRTVSALVGRGLLLTDEPAGSKLNGDARQAAFYADFGPAGHGTIDALAESTVVVVGANLVTRSMVRSLLEMGVRRVVVVEHAVLSSLMPDERWLDGADVAAPVPRGERLAITDDLAVVLDDASIICATSDLGEADALRDVGRDALTAGRRFLPGWIGDMIGHVGPLTYPFETACLRCYRLRVDSNDPQHEAARAVREHVTTDPSSRQFNGLLPPMAAVTGEIMAMEVAKAMTGFAPSDAVGRHIEINLVSFASSVRRVLKVPRCPDCSEVMQRPSVALTVGPQIPHRG